MVMAMHTPRKLVAGIGTKHNKSFLKKLLNVFEIRFSKWCNWNCYHKKKGFTQRF